MKLYKFEQLFWIGRYNDGTVDISPNSRIEITEYEVKETPQYYVGENFRISKRTINTLRSGSLSPGGDDYMYCLTPDPEHFLTSLAKKQQSKWKEAERKAEEEKKKLFYIQNEMRELEENK